MQLRTISSFIGLGLIMGLAMTPPARAQSHADSAVANDIDVYQRDDFTDAAVTNAHDMLLRVAGFRIVEADADIRGYAAALGNVLIDGARPASKRESIEALLERIPADSVERIELLRHGAAMTDMGGYPVLANVVRRRDAAVEAAVEFGGIASTEGWTAPQGQLEYTHRRGERTLDLALKIEPELDDDSGHGTIRTIAPDGTLLDDSGLDTRTIKLKHDASAGWRQPFAGGQLTLNAALRGERSQVDTVVVPHAATMSAELIDERVDEHEDFREAEAGLRFERNIGASTTLGVMVSQQLGWLDAHESAREDDGIETFEETTDTGESIGRIDLAHAWSPAWSLDAALEGAFNFLQSDARLQRDGAPVALPGSDVRIEERRIVAAAGTTWTPTDDWVFETGLQVENSIISQTGDTPLERRFTHVKPRFSVRHELDERNRLRLSLSREVGQLDFGDFVASAALETDQVTAGNAALAPDRTWRLAVAWEHRFDNEAAFVATLTHDRISDVVDRILITTSDDTFDAPGNIGDGRRRTLTLEFSAPLDQLGFTGARIRSALLWRHSRVTDPVTGHLRPISEENPFEGSITLAQDLPALRMNWGIEIEHIAERETEYRFDEITREYEAAGWTLFVERQIGTHWRVRAEATDLFGRDFSERHEKYDGPRSTASIAEIEHRERVTPGYFSLTFRRSMGD